MILYQVRFQLEMRYPQKEIRVQIKTDYQKPKDLQEKWPLS